MASRSASVVALALAVLLLVACGSTEGLVGAELYGNSCAACHGADGSGRSGPALGAESAAAARTDAELVAVIANGENRMPSYGDRLTSGQIESLVEYLRRLQAAP